MKNRYLFAACMLLLGFGGALSFTATCQAISLERLASEEINLLRSILKALDPLIVQHKQAGTAPLLTFEELHAPLTGQQIAFLDQIRQLDPILLSGSNRKLPAPDSATPFVKLDTQVVFREGKPIRLDTQYLPQPAALAYQQMMAALEADLGKRLLVESGYRSPAYQLYLFIFYMGKHDYSIRETNRFVALPGASEHGCPQQQAIDFITPEGINGEDRPEEFEELQEYGWLNARAHEFGFHLSYPRRPKGSDPKKAGSDPAFEPWHWHWEKSSEELKVKS